MATVGTGKYTYELIEGWGKLPEGWNLGQTAIVTDSQDRVYLFNRSAHPLIVLDREGNYLDSWGGGVLTDAHGMYIDSEDNLYLPVKNNHVVLKYSLQGNLLLTMGARDEPSDTGYPGDSSVPVAKAAGPFNSPSDVALSPTGEIYISDGYGNARVHKFSGSGNHLFSWGTPGKQLPGEFHVPHGVWVHKDGRVFVADRENNRVQIFTGEGVFLTQWTGFARPCDFFIDEDDTVFVPELDAFMSIMTIDASGCLDGPGPPTPAPTPSGWISHGDIYVNQNLEGQRLLKYRRTG